MMRKHKGAMLAMLSMAMASNVGAVLIDESTRIKRRSRKQPATELEREIDEWDEKVEQRKREKKAGRR